MTYTFQCVGEDPGYQLAEQAADVIRHIMRNTSYRSIEVEVLGQGYEVVVRVDSGIQMPSLPSYIHHIPVRLVVETGAPVEQQQIIYYQPPAIMQSTVPAYISPVPPRAPWEHRRPPRDHRHSGGHVPEQGVPPSGFNAPTKAPSAVPVTPPVKTAVPLVAGPTLTPIPASKPAVTNGTTRQTANGKTGQAVPSAAAPSVKPSTVLVAGPALTPLLASKPAVTANGQTSAPPPINALAPSGQTTSTSTQVAMKSPATLVAGPALTAMSVANAPAAVAAPTPSVTTKVTAPITAGAVLTPVSTAKSLLTTVAAQDVTTKTVAPMTAGPTLTPVYSTVKTSAVNSTSTAASMMAGPTLTPVTPTKISIAAASVPTPMVKSVAPMVAGPALTAVAPARSVASTGTSVTRAK